MSPGGSHNIKMQNIRSIGRVLAFSYDHAHAMLGTELFYLQPYAHANAFGNPRAHTMLGADAHLCLCLFMT